MIVVLPIRKGENALPRLNAFLGKIGNEYNENRVSHDQSVDFNFLYESVGNLHPALEIQYSMDVTYLVYVFENRDKRVYFLGYFPHYVDGLRDNKLYIDYMNFCGSLYGLGAMLNILPFDSGVGPMDTFITYYNNSELSHGKVMITTVGEDDEVDLLEFISKLASESTQHQVNHDGRIRGLGLREVTWPDVKVSNTTRVGLSFDFWEEVAVREGDTAERITEKFESKVADMASRKAIDVMSMYCKHDPTVYAAHKYADRLEKGISFEVETPWNK